MLAVDAPHTQIEKGKNNNTLEATKSPLRVGGLRSDSPLVPSS